MQKEQEKSSNSFTYGCRINSKHGIFDRERSKNIVSGIDFQAYFQWLSCGHFSALFVYNFASCGETFSVKIVSVTMGQF